jgi:hypothetical protein
MINVKVVRFSSAVGASMKGVYGYSSPIVIVVLIGQILLIFIPTRKYPALLLSLTVSEATKMLFCKLAYFDPPP